MRRFFARDIPPRATIAVVALVLAATIVTGRDTPPRGEAVRTSLAPTPSPQTAGAPQDQPQVRIVKRQRTGEPNTDLFAPHSWVPKPPPPPPAAPQTIVLPEATPQKAEPPAPPPLPFRYLGQLESRQRAMVFLLRGEEILLVSAGQVVDNTYRIETIADSTVDFVYLPLTARQSLAIPAPADR